VVVVPEALREGLEAPLRGPRGSKVVAVTGGGGLRQESLARGLACVPPGVEIVAVHDAARPMVTSAVIDGVVAGVADGFDGAVAAVPVDDAIKEVAEGGEILEPRSRGGLWRAQTPQAFVRACLETALARALADGIACDDCSEMATRVGYRVRVVPGDPRNIKVTRPGDLDLCERLLGGGP
jgi:2-C-methyl-D-erythritol 4-phosphate cytidylyltransferase